MPLYACVLSIIFQICTNFDDSAKPYPSGVLCRRSYLTRPKGRRGEGGKTGMVQRQAGRGHGNGWAKQPVRFCSLARSRV